MLFPVSRTVKGDSFSDDRQLHHVYQPILDLETREPFGFEALLRYPPYSPESVFQEARMCGRLFELDLYSVILSIRNFICTRSSENYLLFVNIFPSTLIDPLFLPSLEKFILKSNVPLDRIVFEMNESEDIPETPAFEAHLSLLKKAGGHVAMDDVGKGYSSISTLTRVEPDMIKLDKWFSNNLSQSKNKQNYLSRLLDFCGKDILLILEGIENPEDLAAARSLGLPFGQGYLLGLPRKWPEAVSTNQDKITMKGTS